MRRFLVVFLSLTSVHFLMAQSCPNIDFSFGDFTNWQGQTGTCCPISTPTNGITPGRHTIISTNGTDPHTGNNLQLIPPGYLYSAKIGNEFTGSQSESLLYSFIVDSTNFIYYMNYAVVLEDAGHPLSAQPTFDFMAKDSAGNIIPLTTYQVSAGQGIPGFQNYGGVIWKDWDMMAMDFTAYMGQQVTVVARTGDCGQSGHFGYGYIIGGVSGPELKAKFCEGSSTALAEAHDGFKEYLWSTGDTVPSITINNSLSSLECQVKAYGGYTSVLHYDLVNINIDPIIDWESDCDGNINFMDSSIVNDEIISWHWSFGDSSTGSSSATSHIYSAPGIYTAQLVLTTSGGCSDSITQSVSPMPIVEAGTDTSVCAGSLVTLIASGTAANYTWSNAVINGIPFITSLTNMYTLTGEDINGCEMIDSIEVTVFELPTVDLGIDTGICDGSVLIVDAGNMGSNYNWNVGNLTQTIQVDTGGVYSVLVSDINGCESMDSIEVTIFALPLVSLGSDTGICMGSIVSIDAGNSGSTYEWSQGSITQTIQIDTAGVYSVLVSSIYGCEMTDSIEITLFNLPIVDLGNDTSFCGNNIELDAGNTGSFYLWSDGSSAQTFLADTTSNYHVIVTDVNGCNNSDTISVQINAFPLVNFILPTDSICVNHSSFLLSGGSPLGGQYTGPGVNSGVFDPIVAGNGLHAISYSYTDTNGCSNLSIENIEVLGCMGLEPGYETSVQIYPNPSNGYFSIKTNEVFNSFVFIVDAIGRIVHLVFLGQPGNYSISIPEITPGIYFLVGNNNNFQKHISKIIIEN